MLNKFAQRLSELRKEKGISQKELARSLGILERTVSYLENGKRECDFDTLIKIAKFFGVSSDYLLGLTDC